MDGCTQYHYFAGTNSWFCNFMKRHGLNMHIWTRLEQQTSDEHDKILQSQSFLLLGRPCVLSITRLAT
jgi:hypothetical protein